MSASFMNESAAGMHHLSNHRTPAAIRRRGAAAKAAAAAHRDDSFLDFGAGDPLHHGHHGHGLYDGAATAAGVGMGHTGNSVAGGAAMGVGMGVGMGSDEQLYAAVADDDDDESGDELQESIALAEAATRVEGDLAADERLDDVLARVRTKDTGAYLYEPGRPALSRAYEVLVPRTITEQYAHMKYASFMGLFPEINRAWITVDNRLFLWNYHDGSVYAYTDLTQVIITAAIVRPSPGVFLDRIQFALVLATPVEIVMLGVEFVDGSVYGEMRLWPTHFRLPSDNVHMLKIVGTEHGRVFMAGKDGCLYEFVYQQPVGAAGAGGGPASWLRKPLSWLGGVGSSILALAASDEDGGAAGGHPEDDAGLGEDAAGLAGAGAAGSLGGRGDAYGGAGVGSGRGGLGSGAGAAAGAASAALPEVPAVQLTAAPKARKVNHSQSQLARLLPEFLFGGQRDPLAHLVLDESRSPPLLFTLSRDRCILQQWSLAPRSAASAAVAASQTASVAAAAAAAASASGLSSGAGLGASGYGSVGGGASGSAFSSPTGGVSGSTGMSSTAAAAQAAAAAAQAAAAAALQSVGLPGAPLELMYTNQHILDAVRELGVTNSTNGSSSRDRGSLHGAGQSRNSSSRGGKDTTSGDDWSPHTFRLVDLAAIRATDSERRLLVAVTGHGHRVYFGPRLRVKLVRRCPPYVDPWAAARASAPSQAAAALAAVQQRGGSRARGRHDTSMGASGASMMMTPGGVGSGAGSVVDAGAAGLDPLSIGVSLRAPEYRPGTSPRLVRKAFVAGDVVLLADERDRETGQSLVGLVRQPRERSMVSIAHSLGAHNPLVSSAARRRSGSVSSVSGMSGNPLPGTTEGRRMLDEAVDLLPLHPVTAGGVANRVADIREVDPNFYMSLQASCLYKRGEAEPLVGLSECATQHALSRRQFLVLTTTGLLIYVKQRPVDDLREALGLWRRSGSPAAVEAIFRQYGAREACAMCLAVACGGPGQYDDGLSSPLLEAAMLDEQELDELEDEADSSGGERDPELLQRLRVMRQRRRLVSRLPDEELVRYATQAFLLYGDPASRRRAAQHLRRSTGGDPDDPDWQPSDSEDDYHDEINGSSGGVDPELSGYDADGVPGKYSGLAAYLSRLLRAVWDWTITVSPPRERLAPEERAELERMEQAWLQLRRQLQQQAQSQQQLVGASAGGKPGRAGLKSGARTTRAGGSGASGSASGVSMVDDDEDDGVEILGGPPDLSGAGSKRGLHRGMTPAGKRRRGGHPGSPGSTNGIAGGASENAAGAAGAPGVANGLALLPAPVYQRLRFSREQLMELQAPLLRLTEFVRQHVEQLELPSDGGQAGAEDAQDAVALLKVLSVSVEAFHLLQVLSRVHNFPRLVARLPEAQQAELRATKFYRLLTEEGRNLARGLLAQVMDADPEYRRWTGELYQKCRWFFGRADLLHHSAGKLLQTALQLIQNNQGGASGESRRLLDEALRQFKRSSESSRFTRLEAVCAELRRAGLFAGVVDLCLHRATKLASGEIAPPASLSSPADAAGHPVHAGASPHQRRAQRMTPGRGAQDSGFYQPRPSSREWIQSQIDRCHECILDTLAYLTLEQPAASINDFQSPHQRQPQLDAAQREAQRLLVLQECLKSPDERFHWKLYDWLIRHDRQQQDLMNLRSPFVIGFLRSRLSRNNIEILKDYLIHHRLFAEAAKLLANQARLNSPQLTYTLRERLGMLNQACMYARQWSEHASAAAPASVGDGLRGGVASDAAQVRLDLGLPPQSSLSADDLADLEDRKLVCQLQVQVQEQLRDVRAVMGTGGTPGGSEAVARVDRDLEALDSRLLDIQQLWQLARSHRLWESCLAVLSVAQTPQDDRNVALHLWGSIIETEIRRAQELGQRDWSNAVTLKLRQLVQRHREELGGVVFPLRSLIIMLEQVNYNDGERPSSRGYPPLALLGAGVNSLVLLDHYDQLTEPNGYLSTRGLGEREWMWWSVRALLLAHNQPLLSQTGRYVGPSAGAGHFQGLNLFNKCVVGINRQPKSPQLQELLAAFEELRRTFRLP